MVITPEEFKSGFDKNTKWGEAEELVKRLDSETARRLYDSLKMTKAYVGLDMRSEFYMGVISAKFGFYEEE